MHNLAGPEVDFWWRNARPIVRVARFLETARTRPRSLGTRPTGAVPLGGSPTNGLPACLATPPPHPPPPKRFLRGIAPLCMSFARDSRTRVRRRLPDASTRKGTCRNRGAPATTKRPSGPAEHVSWLRIAFRAGGSGFPRGFCFQRIDETQVQFLIVLGQPSHRLNAGLGDLRRTNIVSPDDAHERS